MDPFNPFISHGTKHDYLQGSFAHKHGRVEEGGGAGDQPPRLRAQGPRLARGRGPCTKG